MLTGLSKRPSYEELINELGEDPIKKYPDRRASQIENSNYMSQLATGFQEVLEQNDRLMKEKTKQLLLQDMASSSSVSHHTYASAISSLKSLTSHGLRERPTFLPPQTQEFNIGSPRSAHSATSEQRRFREQLFGQDIQPEVLAESLHNQMDIDDDERRRQENQQHIVTEFRHHHGGIHTTIERMVPPPPDVNVDSLEDIMINNIFEGVFSGGASSSTQTPVKKMVENIEKKEKKEPNEEKQKPKEEKKEPKPKREPKKVSKPNDEPDNQPETTLGRSSSRPKRGANTPPSGRPEPKRKPNKEKSDDDDVAITGIKLNKNTSINFWAQQTPNEMRAQLKLRDIPKASYIWLKKPQLIEFIRNLIKDYKW